MVIIKSMNIQEKINEDFKNAMKAGDAVKVDTLRMVFAAFKNKEIEKKGKGQEGILSDEEAIEVLAKEAKKRKESMDIYAQNNRAELAEKEKKELEVINQYLPEQFSEEEIEKIVVAAISKTGATTIKDMGKVMGEVAKETKGRADSKLISEIIKKKLGQV